MKHVFALLAFALMSSGLAQFPNYLPTDDLVAWYGFNSHLEELTANGEPVEVFDLDFGPDRFNVDQHSLQFNGSSSRAIIDWELIDLNAEYTLQVWALSTNQTKTFQCVVNSVPHNGFGLSYNWGGNGTYSIWGGDGETWNICSQCLSQVPINAGEWNHLVYRRESDSLELWINGVMASQVSDIAGDEEVVMAKAWVGATSLNNEFFEGLIDDLGVWQRALTQEEILALYDAPAPTFGCLDASACNYDAGADLSDDSCLYPGECGECGGQGVLGCMDINACNFDEAATCPSDECIYFPVVDLGEDLIMCEESVVLAAGNVGLSYLWSNDATTSEIEVTQSGGYSVEVSVSSGLASVASDISGFQHIGSLEQSHYYVSEASILWEEAKINCELMGGHLVTISSEEENELVWQGVYANGLNPGGSNNYQAWIGLYQNFDAPDYSEPAGGWEWVTGEPVEYSNWGSTEPNNTDQGYFVHMTDANGACLEGDDICGTWDDANISGNLQSAFYVLELPIESSLCTSSDSVFVDFNHGSCFCGANAVWDESLGECVGQISPSSACGPGTYWDEQGQECIILVPSDTDFDGCVSMVDLLDLLTVFGTCVEVPWVCGDPLEYQGYDYATVSIGEQCWFAENLRAVNSMNGDQIAHLQGHEDWVATDEPGWCYYEDSSGTDLPEFGKLYNFYVIGSGMCPSGWHVPNFAEWFEEGGLRAWISEEFPSIGIEAGGALKSTGTTEWLAPNEGATNEFHFNGRPSGGRNLEGEFIPLGTEANFHINNTFGGGEAHHVYLKHHTTSFDRDSPWQGDTPATLHWGASIRCIQDSE